MRVEKIIIHLEHINALSSQSGLAQDEPTECHPNGLFFKKMQSEILSNQFYFFLLIMGHFLCWRKW